MLEKPFATENTEVTEKPTAKPIAVEKITLIRQAVTNHKTLCALCVLRGKRF
jgi:hypothetical protein